MTLLIIQSFIIIVVKSDKLSLLCIGDWGGESDEIPSNEAQRAASAGMSKVSKEIDAQGVLLLGDNFYDRGVEKNTSIRLKKHLKKYILLKLLKNCHYYDCW